MKFDKLLSTSAILPLRSRDWCNYTSTHGAEYVLSLIRNLSHTWFLHENIFILFCCFDFVTSSQKVPYADSYFNIYVI